MTNSKLVHYLNSGVKVQDNRDNRIIDLKYEGNFDTIISIGTYLNLSDRGFFIPYLYPLSCITEPIPIDGEMKIPLVELAKIEGSYKGEDYVIKEDWLLWIGHDGISYAFRYNEKSFDFDSDEEMKEGDYNSAGNQFLLFQKMIEWKINIFPEEIKSIDPRKLGDNNPYKI